VPLANLAGRPPRVLSRVLSRVFGHGSPWTTTTC
jgi:hypothetical protein